MWEFYNIKSKLYNNHRQFPKYICFHDSIEINTDRF